jgi:hypothetical protein
MYSQAFEEKYQIWLKIIFCANTMGQLRNIGAVVCAQTYAAV